MSRAKEVAKFTNESTKKTRTYLKNFDRLLRRDYDKDDILPAVRKLRKLESSKKGKRKYSGAYKMNIKTGKAERR